MDNREWIERAERVLLRNYRPAPMVLCEGSGCRLKDVEGNSYLDLCAGIAVAGVGHGHPVLARAIASQAGRLMHVSNLFYNDRAIELASQLVDRTVFDRVFFCNSGAEAIEALIKLARRFHHGAGHPERTKLVAMEKSFHGRTLGALTLTGQPKYHEGMGPLVGNVEHVPFGDLDALRRVVDDRTAAVLLEPVQGEGGVVVPDPAYLQGARELCDARGALLLFDEIQTGYGRTGKFLAREWSGVVPDACSLAKGIGGGFPLGAVATREAFADALPPGSHATTFGGNPLACAAGLAVLEIFDGEDLVARSQARGEYLGERLSSLAGRLACVAESRGLGLLRGLALADGVDPAAIFTRIREAGVLLSLAGGNVLRFSPPLCVSEEELDEGLAVVESVLSKGV